MAISEHLEKLRHFHRLTHYDSIREASVAMGISQAGLSKSISNLENALGAPLFLRARSGLTLTKEGKAVLQTSEVILKEALALEMKLSGFKSLLAPTNLHIGMYDSIAVYFFSELNAYLSSLYPNVRIVLTVDTSAALAKEISSGRLDLALGVNFDKCLSQDLQFFKLFDDHYSFYVSSRHNLELGKLPLLIHPGADNGKGEGLEVHLRTTIKKHGAHRIYNFETLKTLTSQGLGVGVLPTQVAKPLMERGVLTHAELGRNRTLFGLHSIGFLASKEFLKSHGDFANDLFRLGDRWSKK